MLLEFLGAAHEVTGSCHFVQSGGKNMLVDCGMEQDRICMRIRRYLSMPLRSIMCL